MSWTWSAALHFPSNGETVAEKGLGKTKSQNGKARDTDLSLSTLLSDLLGLIQHLYPDPDSSPSFVVSPSIADVCSELIGIAVGTFDGCGADIVFCADIAGEGVYNSGGCRAGRGRRSVSHLQLHRKFALLAATMSLTNSVFSKRGVGESGLQPVVGDMPSFLNHQLECRSDLSSHTTRG